MVKDNHFYFNGINATTGDYAHPPLSRDELSAQLPADLAPLEHQQPPPEIDLTDLSQTGWGIIFTHDVDPAIKEALKPLLDVRREQTDSRFRLYEKGYGYQVGQDTVDTFLVRFGVGPGPANPDQVPYYLLIVGSPQQIPFDFQTRLATHYAVGRLHFDTVEAYASYAQNVVAAEAGQLKLPRRLSLFGSAHPDDPATTSITDHLLTPLYDHFKDRPAWAVNPFLKDKATKAILRRLLGGDQTPALLVAAGHSLLFSPGDSEQLTRQGGLLCQEWPGPTAWTKAVPSGFHLSRDDLTDETEFAGLLAFLWASFSVGTPQTDTLLGRPLAPQPFLAALPGRLLERGALAVVGHLNRAVACGDGTISQNALQTALTQLLDGHSVGAAMAALSSQTARLAKQVQAELEALSSGQETDTDALLAAWVAVNNLQRLALLGDPAVRLPMAPSGEIEAGQVEPQPISAPMPAPTPSTRGSLEMAAPTPPGNEVHFSAYHPRAINFGEWHKLLVYAHLNSAIEAIKTDAGQILGQALREYGQSGAKANTLIEPGTEITLIPQGFGLEFNPPQATVVWADAWQRADFEMRATGQRVGHVIEGSIACYVGPLLIADIRLPVVVPKPGERVPEAEQTQTIQSAKMYQAVFCSYSHADTAIVEAVETAYKALGMDYLRDVMNLKSGQSWSDQLLSMIEQADIFQLFWSGTSCKSPYVEQEWQYALNLIEQKGPTFIRPVYWEQPIPPVPAAMSHLHFAPVDFSNFVEAAPEPEKGPVTGVTVTSVSTQSLPSSAVQLERLLPTGEEDVKTLTVSTYSTADPAQPDPARLKARTTISLTGDTEVYLPETLTDEDKHYLKLHHQMVKEALAARLAYLELIAKLVDRS